MADFRGFLQEGTFPERKALIRNFVEGIEVVGDEATLTYTIPMPNDGVTSESASVLDFVQSDPPCPATLCHVFPYHITIPPSTLILCPVMYSAPGEHRYAATPAISSSLAARRMGTPLKFRSHASALG